MGLDPFPRRDSLCDSSGGGRVTPPDLFKGQRRSRRVSKPRQQGADTASVHSRNNLAELPPNGKTPGPLWEAGDKVHGLPNPDPKAAAIGPELTLDVACADDHYWLKGEGRLPANVASIAPISIGPVVRPLAIPSRHGVGDRPVLEHRFREALSGRCSHKVAINRRQVLSC